MTETQSRLFKSGKARDQKDWVFPGELLEPGEAQALYFFCEGLFSWLSGEGMVYRGVSFSYRVPLSVLTIKAFKDGQGLVSFINGETLAKCMAYFARRVSEGTVEWRPDRFA